jgi:hypothetical protein
LEYLSDRAVRVDTETVVEAVLTQEYWITLMARALSALAKAVHYAVQREPP